MTDKPDTWMPLYVSDWDASTRHLDVAEDGAYGRLVRFYWRNGPPPDDDAKLARIVGATLPRWLKMRATLAAFFAVGDGVWRHKRVELELERAAAAHARAVERARAGGRAKAAMERASSTPQACLENAHSQSHTGRRASKKALLTSGRECADERAGGSSPPHAWLGPAEIREHVVQDRGEDYAGSWLDTCDWQDLPERMILTRTQIGAERLWRDFRKYLSEHDISVGLKQSKERGAA